MARQYWCIRRHAEQRDNAERQRPRAQHAPISKANGRQYYRKDKQCFFVKARGVGSKYKTFVSVPQSQNDRLGAVSAKRHRKKASAAESTCSSSSGGRLADSGSSRADPHSDDDI